MHEVGLMEEAIEQAVRVATDAGAARIQRLTCHIRPGGHVTRDVIDTLFTALSRGTLAEGAELDIATQELTDYLCWSCGSTFSSDSRSEQEAACPACGSLNLTAAQAPDLTLVSIDVPELGVERSSV